MANTTETPEAGFMTLAFSTDVVRRALKVSLVVGTLLALINHVDAVVNGAFATKNFVQVVLSFLVPYLVSTYSAVHALQGNKKATRRLPLTHGRKPSRGREEQVCKKDCPN